MINNTEDEKKREHYYLSKEIRDYILKYKEKNKLTKSKAIESIIKEHEEFSRLSSKEMYKEIAKNITENLKEEYGKEVKKSKQQSSNTDKNVQVLLEMFNCFILNNWKDTDVVMTTDITKSELLETSEKEIERRIYKGMYEKHGGID